MELHERIKKRRIELGLTQEELAASIGYSDRSTIAKIEKGTNDIVHSKISDFATSLDTTAAYLMGLTDDPYDYELDPDGLFSEIPLGTLDHLTKLHRGDMEAVWNSYQKLEEAGANDFASETKKPRYRSIARLEGATLTPEQDKKIHDFIKYIESHPEESDDLDW